MTTTYLDAVVDMSHWNRVTDWAQVRAAAIVGVILKATQGSNFIDRTFTSRAVAAASAGLLVGAYHFVDASDPVAQAKLFLSVAGGLPALMLDIEANAMPGGTATVEIAAAVASEIASSHGRPPVAYLGRDGPDGRGTGLPNSVLSQGPLMIPEYGTRLRGLPAGWMDWTLWQHTDAATVPGITGHVDRSYFNGDEAALRAWWAGG